MLQYELTRKEILDKQQAKIDAREERDRQNAEAKARADAKWAAKQRAIEMGKVGQG